MLCIRSNCVYHWQLCVTACTNSSCFRVALYPCADDLRFISAPRRSGGWTSSCGCLGVLRVDFHGESRLCPPSCVCGILKASAMPSRNNTTKWGASVSPQVVTKTLTFQQAFAAYLNDVIWLIVIAFFFARGFVKVVPPPEPTLKSCRIWLAYFSICAHCQPFA